VRAACWMGKESISVQTVDDPKILAPRDAIVKVTLTSICGSDLHLYNGVIPAVKRGDILGHEFMGEVVEVGPEVKNLKAGDKVVVPFTISCGNCFYCKKDLWSLCDNTNQNAEAAARMFGYSPAGLFGYTHLFGGYAGGQAEAVRVPFADVGPIKIQNGVPDERVLFLSDILPTGYQAAENCRIRRGDTVAVWGCGPVGQMAVRCAFLLGAERVIAIDDRLNRLKIAAAAGAETIRFGEDESVFHQMRSKTGGRGPDSCIDAVGLEAHGRTPDGILDTVKSALMLATDRIHALRQAIRCCRKGGIVSIPGVYAGIADKFPIGAAFNKGLTLTMGQTHVQKYLKTLLDLILDDRLDPSFVVTDRAPLERAPDMYRRFRNHPEECLKGVMHPGR
jgi:threonine dehydrogenase-like Zn-dependent dehydrogenase